MPAEEDAASLTISPEKVCFIIVKAREFDAKDAVTDPDPGSNPSDDAAVLEDHSDDPVLEELTSLIDFLIGRRADRPRCADVARARRLFRERVANGARRSGSCSQQSTANYLLDTPLLGDFLEEGLLLT
jgi:hypothetical protein